MRTALLCLAPLLGACTIHLHVHESPEPQPEHAPSRADNHTISGTVRDLNGNPVAAHVALVMRGGSYSMGIGKDGRFRFDDVRHATVTVSATTKDDRIAIQPNVERGTEDLHLPAVEPGARVTVTMTGHETMRLALFDGDARFRDNTVRDGKPASFVVPARPIRVRLYGNGFEQELETELSAGAEEKLIFHFEE